MPNSYPATGPALIDGVKVTNAYGTLYQYVLPSGTYREDLGVTPALEINASAYEVQTLTLTSYQRGAAFGHNIAGQNSLTTTTGRVWLNYISGTRTLIGAGITDDGATQLQVKGGIKADAFKLTTSPAAGKVLTSDAAGNGSWQSVALGASVNITTVSILSNISVGDLNAPLFATWSQSGKVVDLEVYGTTRHMVNGVNTQFKFTIPASIPQISQGVFGQGTVRSQITLANNSVPMFALLSNPTAQEVVVAYWPTVGGGGSPSGVLDDFVVRIRYTTP